MAHGPPHFHVLAQTSSGRRAVGLLIASLALWAATFMLICVGVGPWFAVTDLPAIVTTLSGGIAAGFAVFRDGERGAIVVLPLLGALALVGGVIAEIIGHGRW